MQKSQAEVDAITLLQMTLDELFKKTAVDCATKMMQYWDSPHEIGADGTAYMPHSEESIVVSAVGDWREKSLEHITAGFHCLLQAAPRSLSSRAARDRAAELTWEAIDRVYGWQDGRRKTSRFREWFMDAGAQSLNARNTPMDFDLPLMHGECRVNKRTYAQLSCDFRCMFENRLAALRLGSAMASFDVGQTRPAEKQHLPEPAQVPWYYTEDLRSRNSRVSMPTRGKLVQDIKLELARYSPHLHKLASQYKQFASSHSDCIAFDIFARATQSKRDIFIGCISDRKHEELAYELAADVANKGAQAMKRAWIEYRKSQNNGG